MASCAVTSVIAKDPRFQSLKEAYKDKHYNDDHLAEGLQLCREYHAYNDDWFPETPAQRSIFTRFMNHYLVNAKLAKTDSNMSRDSVYNLYTTLYSVYTPEQLDNRVNMIVRNFRDLVDRLEKNDRRGRSRQEIIKAFGDKDKNGYQKLIEKVFDIYDKNYTDVDKMMDSYVKANPNATDEQKSEARKTFEYRAQEFKTLLANKERLAAIASTRIGEDEGFVVNIKDFQVSFEDPSEEDQLSDGNTEAGENNGEDKEEGSKGDRYGDFRTLKLLNTLSPRARRLISRIPKVDNNGNQVRDDIGVSQYIGGRQVATVLKRVLVNSSPDTMMSDLAAAADFYPWIKGLIDVLEKNTDEQTTIYANFKNAETTYVYTAFENGRYVPHIANSRSGGYALMREAGNNLRAGYVMDDATSIYTGYGALKSLEEIQKVKAQFEDIRKRIQSAEGAMWIRMVDGDKPLQAKRIEEIIEEGAANGKDLSYLRESPVDAMQGFLRANPDIAPKLSSLLRGMGFAVSENDIKTIALQTMKPKGFRFLAGYLGSKSQKGRNKLYQLVEYMGSVYGRAEEIYKKDLPATGQYLYNTTDGFKRINSALALSQYKEVEDRVVNEGKSLSTYNNVNLLHQTFDELMNKQNLSEENYQEYLENEFLQYEGMALGNGDRRQVYGWLKLLQDNTGNIREKLRVIDSAAFNHVEYAELSRGQKLTNSLVMYLEGGHTFQQDDYALYEVPIQADYSTAYNFILAPKFNQEAEVVEALTNEVLIELERIAAIEARQNDASRIELSVYEKQGMKFQIFPEFNDNGFREQYSQIQNAEDALNFVREQVAQQLTNVIAKDFATIEEAKILSNPAMKKVDLGYGNYGSIFSENNRISELNEKAVNALRMYALNVYYARQQMTKLVVGGTEQFNGLIDFEKRNMLEHATRSSLNTKATWNGVRVGRDTQNVVYIEDDESASAFLDDIKEMLNQLLENKVISKSQFDTMIKSYSKIKTTDGQGFRTLDSYRRVQIMSGQWNKEHERAYNAIISGNPTKDDISVFMQNIKPVLTGYETIPAAAGENQKPVKATVLHKYSEAVLLPMALSKYCLQNQSVPLQAFERAQERLKKQGKEIDMFLFHSGVKVGAHSIIQPFAKKDGNRIISDEKSIEDYIVNSVIGKESVMHTLPFKYYGIAASTPAHAADDRIAWASQAEKVAWANILKGQKIRVRGKEMDAWDARELYFDIKTANIVESFKQIREFFADSDKLEKVFQEELASKSYSSSELQYALAHLKDGTFAVPLYSPNVEHQVQELLSSIIKKRLTKPKVKGANILQTTGLGMDIEASSFDNNNALSEDQKLRVVFDGTGSNKRIKYVEVYMPIHDSRLKMFADKDGNIGPERLKELVDKGIIPETILEFIAYRTPSDAEHSVIPCRIKGFIANTGGATIRMPKEIMVMTGHDYDGDKMRCHFKDFRLVDKEGSELELSDEDIALMVLGQKNINSSFRKVEAYEYDYDKPAIENSLKARNNARVELMFSELTSPAGSQRMIIPGGCDETKVIAKSLYLVRAAANDEVKSKIAETLVRQGVDSRNAYSVVRSTTSLYNTLVRKSDKDLSDIVREVSSTETPYSVTHSADAFDYIMGGSQMIGIYATYNSALQMLQRLDMNYIPALTKKGKPYTVTLFGNTFDKLFAVNNHNGRLASLGLARLLNAAVDNNKDPLLGYLNQTKEMSELTFLMFAAGMSEEEIHLIMNQPSVIELINRMKSRDNKGIIAEIKNLIDELSANSQELGEITPWIALDKIKLMDRDDFIRNLASTHESIRTGDDFTAIQQQIYVLQTLRHLEPAANNLATFVRLTRPESESGAIGTSISDIIAKVTELNKFRNTLAMSEDSDIRISGMREILEKRDVNGGWDTNYIEEIIGSKLPEVVALNSLMLDSSLDMFKPLFPQAKDDWVNLAAEIANQYSYNKVQEGTVAKIGQEMILWKLLSNNKFITGNPQEEQKRIIIDVPKNLKDLKQRIANVSQNPGTDAAAEELIGNAFLNNLTTTDPQNSNTAPRLRFSLNGAPVEGTRDLISSSWNAMLSSSDKSIRDLAIDLFKYNLYTNGFSYGMYEFAHFAPFSVLMSTPGYIEALQDVLKSNWNSEEERENFINQYYMNHWGDKKFIPSYNIKALRISSSNAGSLVLSNQDNDEKVINKIKDLRYIVLRSGEKGEVQTLYRVAPGQSDSEVTLIKAQKLGVRNRSQQITLQYNPTVSYTEVTPVVPGNDSAWGQLDELNTYAEGDINAEGQRPFNPNPFGIVSNPSQPLGLNFFGIKPVATQLQRLEEKAEKEAEKNEGKLDVIEQDIRERIIKYHGQWDRVSVKEDTTSLYIFTDNTDRDSGRNPISPNSWYSRKYGEGHHFPTMTAAVIRGLDNARPISTQRYYHEGAKREAGRWHDSDFDEFKSIIDSEFTDILSEWRSGKYKRIVFPAGNGNSAGDGLFNAAISAITKQRTPILYDYLQNKVNELVAAVNTEDAEIDYGLTVDDFNEFSPAGADATNLQMPMPMSDAFGLGMMDMSALQGAVARVSTGDDDYGDAKISEYADGYESAMAQAEAEEEEYYRKKNAGLLNIVRRDENGNIVSENVPATPANISQARKQKTFVELNKKLRDILRSKGIDVGVLTNAEAMMSLGGVADFDTANVTAEGLLEMIRIAEGYEGEQALPEEFAHVAIEMLGHEHPLVKRLLAAIENNPEALNEAYGEMYSEYADRYGEDNHDKLVLEAAGKLVAKQLFRQQQIETKPVRRLIQRVIDAIKSLFRKFRREEVQNAIFDANDIASKLAREMLGGKLLDQMSVMNINQSGLFQSVKKDITNKNDILSKLLKNELKRLSILKRREGYRTKDKQSKSITATEMQITKLESAIKNYKTEDAIVTYMSDSLTFLASMEKSLDDAVNSGRPVNTICKKLNMVRDTLYSFSAAIEDVREAIREGEVQDNIGIEQSLAQVSNVLANFHQKYESYARTYFEEMLSNVYGEHGKTVTIGKDKGRKISIHEMATKADHDISLISRWFNSLADCNDYVLRAIDDVTRDAKLKARRRASALRPRIEVAISELEKATGSRDQSFMFETIKGEDGKIRRTGKYISKKEADKLPEAKRKFYDTMMEIKKEVDQFIPDSLLEDRKIIMLRKYTMDKFKDAEGAKGKALEAWDGLKNRVMDTSDNIDFENYEVAVDFEGNRVDMLPVKFLLKGKNESYDDMTDDVATSMMAYAGMAIEYNELNNVIGILENAKFMASERDIAQTTGNRKQRETISTDNYIFHSPFTKKQAISNAQKALEDFFQMHIYGHIQKNEGTFGNTRISKRKVVDTINMITSYSQMAINIPQRIANVSTGMTQIAIESVGKGVFGAKDVAWASKIYMKESGDRLVETGKTDYDNKLSLWDEYFDVHQNNGRNQTKYKKGRMSRIFNSSLLYAGLTMGEDYLASTTSLSIAHTIKVKSPSGKIETLWDAYEVKYSNPANKTGAYLSLKDGYTKEDGSPITFEDEKRFAKLSAGMNFELQGIYNLDDRSAVQQYAFGALIIMYRKWIAPALKRRYSGVNYNLLKDDYQEGYHRTMFRFVGEFMRDAKNQVTEEEGAKALINIVEDMKALKTSIMLNWNKMNDYEKSNVKRSLTELAIVAGLWLSCSLLGKVPPPDYGDDEPGAVLKWFDQTLMSQMLRLRTEIGSQAPTPMFVDEALHLLKSPFAAIAPLQNTIDALNLLVPSNYLTEIKSGRYRGHSKAYKYFRELPVISMFKKVDNFIDPSPLINYYKNDVVM